MFSFLANFPLVYFEGTKENLPKKIVYTVTYLIGDEIYDREGDVEIKESFYKMLYLFNNMVHTNIPMYPLMLLEDSPEIGSRDIFMFSGLNNKGIPYYNSLMRGEKIERPDLQDEVYKIFYYIPGKSKTD